MTRQREREEFIAIMAKEGIPLDVTRKVLRYSATLQRLAEAQCNGDYPADNGERKVVPCSRCEGLWVRSSLVRDHAAPKRDGYARRMAPLICKDCRTEELVKATVTPYGITPIFQGDPRGCVVKLVMPPREGNRIFRNEVGVP